MPKQNYKDHYSFVCIVLEIILAQYYYCSSTAMVRTVYNYYIRNDITNDLKMRLNNNMIFYNGNLLFVILLFIINIKILPRCYR